MTSRLLAVTFDASDPDRLAGFWAALLDRDVIADADGVLVPGDGTQVSLRFCPTRADKTEPNRLHLHLTSDGSDGTRWWRGRWIWAPATSTLASGPRRTTSCLPTRRATNSA